MSQSLASLKRLVEATIKVTDRPQGVRGPLRGKDFMVDDLTVGADRDGH